MGPAVARSSPWQNRPMRWWLFLLLLGLPAALLVVLVLVIRGGQSHVRESAGGSAESGAGPPGPQAARTGVKLVRVGRFDSPLYVISPPGDARRLMVVEQGGTIRVVRGGKKLAQPFFFLAVADSLLEVLHRNSQLLIARDFLQLLLHGLQFYGQRIGLQFCA